MGVRQLPGVRRGNGGESSANSKSSTAFSERPPGWDAAARPRSRVVHRAGRPGVVHLQCWDGVASASSHF